MKTFRKYLVKRNTSTQHTLLKKKLVESDWKNQNISFIEPLSFCNLTFLIFQTLVTSAVMLSSASCGMPVGYSAILLPQLKNVNDSMQIDDEIGSWIGKFISLLLSYYNRYKFA